MLALGCGWACGFSAYLTVFVLGLILRAQDNLEPGLGLAVLTSYWILVPAGVLALVELIVGKMPRWDVGWHRWHGKVRIPAALVLAWMAGGGGAFPIDVRLVVALMGGAGAFLIHAARTSARVAMHGAGTQAFAVPLAGVVEDLLLCSLLLPIGLGNAPVTTMMISITFLASLLALGLTWKDSKKLMLDMILGTLPAAEPKKNEQAVRRDG